MQACVDVLIYFRAKALILAPASCEQACRRREGIVAIREASAAMTALALLAICETAIAGEFTVEIGGAEGTAFGGTCLLVSAGKNAKHETSGMVPLTFEFAGDIISCAIQRRGGSGELRIVIKDHGGRTVAESSQTQPFGVVMAAGR
jgi:hypothetical protein